MRDKQRVRDCEERGKWPCAWVGEFVCAGYGVWTASYCADDIYSLIKCVIDLMTYMYSTNSVSNKKF